MDDFKLIARLLAAIRAGETEAVFNMALVNEKVLKATAGQRDAMAIKLQKAGYIDGLWIEEDVDNQRKPVILWSASNPSVTLSGLEYIRNCHPLQKAIREMKNAGISAASRMLENTLFGMLG